MATPAKKQPKLSAFGWKIPFFGKLTKRSPLRNKDMNVLVQCLNALGAMEIREGKTNAVLFSDNNVVLQIKRGGGGSAELDTETNSVDNADQTVLNLVDGDGVEVTNTSGGTVQFVSGATRMRIKSIQNEYCTCRTYDGTTEGDTDIFVAKSKDSRTSAATISHSGLTWDVTYTNQNQRTCTTGSGAQQQQMEQRLTPPYTVDDVLFAVRALNGTGVTTATDWIEVAPCRSWVIDFGGSNIQFRGEYHPDVTYVIGDMVVVPTGVNSGTYICVKNNPGAANSPWLGGGYWVKLPSGNALGQWM